MFNSVGLDKGHGRIVSFAYVLLSCVFAASLCYVL